ncbi:hypothetical protein BV22DRAFT_1131580 [Leucogyrophana mollusca]|uniref:Uncharacterized protein n=1 Tax=Leucogyrophana mollusca TaxID=85980 RepID=A0ACB8BAG6_9AGAM|nr:hypothetical protein BV22DRAFT_1131580 [Leucogyrophana mollusca]
MPESSGLDSRAKDLFSRTKSRTTTRASAEQIPATRTFKDAIAISGPVRLCARTARKHELRHHSLCIILRGHGGTTTARALGREEWVGGFRRSSRYIHYRMALGIVGRKLTTFHSSYEFTRGSAGAMEAHKTLPTYCILLTDGGEGLLIGWDLSI